jgi:acetyl esterase/lipase
VRSRRARWALGGLVLALAVALAAILLLRGNGRQGATVLRDQAYTGHDGTRLKLDVFEPAGRRSGRPAVLILHGGSWRGGARADLESLAVAAQQQGFVAVNVDYSLDAKPAFPAELEDVQAAIRWVRDHADEIGADPAKVGALGISAGGHLAALAATVGRGPLTSGARLGAVVTWSAPMNLAALTGYAPPPSNVLWNLVLTDVLGCTIAQCPQTYVTYSPVSNVTADDPPMMIVNSLAEPSVPYIQAQAMADRMRMAGVPVQLLPVPGASHAGYAAVALVPSLAFLRAQLDRVARSG